MSTIKSIVKVIDAIYGLPKLIDYAVFRAHIDMIKEEHEEYVVVNGDVREIILYEVKSGRSGSSKDKDKIKETVDYVKKVRNDIGKSLNLKLRIINVPIEVDFPMSAELKIIEY